VDLIIGCSEYITNKVRQRFPEFSERCHTVYNGTDLSQFSPREDRGEKKRNGKVLLYAGRLSPEKGAHVLLDAFSIVLKKHPDASLRIAGPVGSASPQTTVAIFDEKRIRDLGQFYPSPFSEPDYYYRQLLTWLPPDQMKQVSFLGNVPHSQIQDVYHSVDIFINSSFFEAFPLTNLEAIASGLPVVASAVGGVPELIRDGETGLLFPPGDSGRLAEAIIRLLEDDDLYQRLKTGAIQEIQQGKFSWDVAAEEILRYYQRLSTLN
jgi:glycosyltransferase involved in cell wall biosynthesis